VSDHLIESLAEQPRLLYELSPRKFEELVAELYQRQGFEALLTPASGDGGVDVYVVRHDELGSSLTVVQCKRYAANHKIGVALVRELHGTVAATGASTGVLLTTSFFTGGARSIEKEFKYRLSLQDFLMVHQLLQDACRH
jgi:restriction system protein